MAEYDYRCADILPAEPLFLRADMPTGVGDPVARHGAPSFSACAAN